MVLQPSRAGFSRLRMLAGAGCAALMIAAAPMGAVAQSAVTSFNIRSAPLSQSLLEFGRQAGISIAADQSLTSGLRGRAVSGDLPVNEALDRLLIGTGLSAEFAGPNAVRLVRAGQGDAGGNDLQLASQEARLQDTTSVADVIVTAQKREESIQSVPIAVSAFSAENLDAMKIEGGSELMRAIPNVAFSKGNFSMYNFSIRGVGTKAISAASDPAVAVSFNNTPLIRNRLFEQEYLDVSRVEVLRGPQGTLYGRNATGGVVNMIPNLPEPDFDAMLKAEAGNYGSMRGQMMVNLPFTDTFWVRAAASLTKREGFDYNTHNETKVNGRDLYTTRLSAAWEPTDRFRANLIWERFEEDDNRSRTGKQLCTTDPGPTRVGSYTITDPTMRARLSQGCQPGSLYDDAAYGTPNGTGMAAILAAGNVGWGFARTDTNGYAAVIAVKPGVDPYAGVSQSRNLREISTKYDPKFRAKNDVYQLNLEWDLTDSLRITSQTTYAKDEFWSTQDYMRYLSSDIISDSSGLYSNRNPRVLLPDGPAPGGVFVDPQLGPSSGMLSADLNTSSNNQIFQELRMQSNFGGKFDFSLGVNYLNFKTEDNYYVFNNMFTLLSQYIYNAERTIDGRPRTSNCQSDSPPPGQLECVYVDMSPISNLVGDGHNYFRSKNVVTTESWGLFGESYTDLTDNLKLTIGLRYTKDEKTSTPFPSQLLLGSNALFGGGLTTGGSTARGYPAWPDIVQSWDAFTGRLVLDWKPSDNVMTYASYARGYKGGGSNPPRPDINPKTVQFQALPEVFDPEYINSFEFGIKTRILENRIKLNGTAFFYDYKDYQVSQIQDRIALNENFDAQNYGFEVEFVYDVTPKFRLDANIGYLKTKISDNESSIDVMNRTQGNSDWTVIRPWIQVPSNCVAPTSIVEKILRDTSPHLQSSKISALQALCGGSNNLGTFTPGGGFGGTPWWRSDYYGISYNPLTDAPNGGRGFEADLSGNELPNSPRWTASFGAQYTVSVLDYDVTVRGDHYIQDDSYFRVYNTPYDRIRGWNNTNLSVSVENIKQNLLINMYIKNVFNKQPIVDAFTNSDDSLLTTNVFALEPRIVGISMSKRF